MLPHSESKGRIGGSQEESFGESIQPIIANN
jgi:hypothetical protein